MVQGLLCVPDAAVLPELQCNTDGGMVCVVCCDTDGGSMHRLHSQPGTGMVQQGLYTCTIPQTEPAAHNNAVVSPNHSAQRCTKFTSIELSNADAHHRRSL